MVLLGVAVWRAGLGPRWLGMIAWVVVEFVGTGLSEWASYVSGVLYAVVFVTLAIVVARSSVQHWLTAAESGSTSAAARAAESVLQ